MKKILCAFGFHDVKFKRTWRGYFRPHYYCHRKGCNYWLEQKTQTTFEIMEEFVVGFTEDDSLTPIDIVADVTGLTIDEVRSCCEVVQVPDKEPDFD